AHPPEEAGDPGGLHVRAGVTPRGARLERASSPRHVPNVPHERQGRPVMSETPSAAPVPAPVALLRGAGRALRLAARVLLGLFVLWQLLFIPAYNVLEAEETVRKAFAESREEEG